MSYEEDFRRPYIARCACGKGYLRKEIIYYSNDWNQTRESETAVEIDCENCRDSFYFAQGKLIPKGMSFPNSIPTLPHKYTYTEDERFVGEHDKTLIEKIIDDMTAPKHTYIRDLRTEEAQRFANNWVFHHRKKSLAPMVSYLKKLIANYDVLHKNYELKKPYVDKYLIKQKEFAEQEMQVLEKAFEPTFELDEVLITRQRQQISDYKEAHKYDPFDATVIYDDSYKKDYVGQYWDTLLIEQCSDANYLLLDKPDYGKATVILTKKYICSCSICGKKQEVISSAFRIEQDESGAFFSGASCDCHEISSFEAKTMDILNSLGITYRRELSFDDLVGDSGKKLRFDFALYRHDCDDCNLLIELQGPHHYLKGYYEDGSYVTDGSSKSEERLSKQLKYDRLKQVYCESKGIPLECIKYTVGNDYFKLEKRIKEILKLHKYPYFTV
ncbi:hypothetical protein SAMN05216413_2620 [Ruminococcaceae bacterium KH2T8]|nr:hypothetical protein SAMN05216413_2620 [Ruminococcaceae bacterium KH2T8]